MKKIAITIILCLSFLTHVIAQCNMGNYLSALPIPVAAYPYTNVNGITVSAATINLTPYTNFTYNCGANAFAGANPAWWINAANASITLTFSVPVCNFTVLVNGTNTTEEFYFNANAGTISLSNFCTPDYAVIGAGNALVYNGLPASGTIISIDNPIGATQYVITHNGLGSGSRISLLDCYVGCQPAANTLTCNVVDLAYCEGESAMVDFVATGTFNAGNIFTAELSDQFGNFATPTAIGSIISTTSGSIPCTIPLGTPTGSGYRIRVVSSNPALTGSNNGANITINAFPSVVANANPSSLCVGQSLLLTGSGASTYTWSGGVQDGISFTPAATATYTVTGIDAIGCSNTNTVTVPVNSIPTVTAIAVPGNSICTGASVTLSGSGATSYSWSAPVSNNTPFSPISTATYTVTGTDGNNCSNTTTITIQVNPNPTITINASPNDSICEGATVSLTGIGANSYTWTGGIQNGSLFSPNATATYTVTGTDVNGCTATAAQLIAVNPLPVFSLGTDVSFCQGDSVVFNASVPNATYLWQNGSNNAQFTAYQSGYYWVTTTLAGCAKSDTVQVTVHTFPSIDLGADTAICEGKSIILDATCPNCTYIWQDNSTLPTFTASATGNYSVTATRNGCSTLDNIDLNIIPLPVVNLGPDTSICIGEKILLDVSRPGGKYLWQDQTSSARYTVENFGTYWVEVTMNGCTNRDEIYVANSYLCSCPVFLPNAFSPNGDLRNDVFKLVNANYIELMQFSVYNRWGEEVFGTKNATIGWEGNYKGSACEVGTYVYVVRYKCLSNGKDYLLKGDVNLVR